jgi:hypothetical protein
MASTGRRARGDAVFDFYHDLGRVMRLFTSSSNTCSGTAGLVGYVTAPASFGSVVCCCLMGICAT